MIDFIVNKGEELNICGLYKKSIIFDGYDNNKKTIISCCYEIDEFGICSFRQLSFNPKTLEIILLTIEAKQYFGVLMSINDNALNFKCFNKICEAKKYQDQYKALL